MKSERRQPILSVKFGALVKIQNITKKSDDYDRLDHKKNVQTGYKPHFYINTRKK